MNLQTLIILALTALAVIILYAVKKILDDHNPEWIADLLREYWYVFVILGIALLVWFVYVLLTNPALLGLG